MVNVTMFHALSFTFHAVRHLNHRGSLYIWANVLWILLSVPIVTAPSAWAALVYMSREAYLKPSVSLDDFWLGFRTNLRRGMIVAVLNLLVIGVNASNLFAYPNQSGILVMWLRGVWLSILVVWIMIQFYMWPLLFELKEPSLINAFRNAAIMIFRNPLYSFTLFLIILAVVITSTLLVGAWPLISGSALAVMSAGAVMERLAAAGLRLPLNQPELGASDFNVGDFE
ncbi:MAG: DUF624 domain-containing protein [Anaerolineaceae bacterium]|nr:DUF624 domain-containing protein [Anaerolineaceae bacterium]